MSLPFLIDAQLPVSLALWFQHRGIDATHVLDHGLEAATDRAIWLWASERRTVIVSKDADFTQLAMLEPKGPAVVWIRIGNSTTASLVARLELVWSSVEAALLSGERLIEIR